MPRPVASAVERERKFSAWPGFAMPDFQGMAGWVVADEPASVVLDAVYWDTSDLRLVRWGVTLRHRTADGDAGRWTLKLPSPDTAHDDLVRTEFDVEAPPDAPPAELLSLARAWVRTATLEPVARLQTVRRSVVLRDGGGRLLAELADDEVSVFEGDRVAARFREVEVEAQEGAPPKLLHLVAERLHAAGAGPADPTPKLARALGPRALAAPEVVVGPLAGDAAIGDVVRAAFGRAVVRLLSFDAGIRLDGGPETVHQARVATRRLRSDLRTFAPVLDEAWETALRDDLAALADVLGAVRDADVLTEHLRTVAEGLGPDAAAGLSLLRRLDREREAARAALLAVMEGPAYAELLDRLVAAARHPAFRDGADERPAVQALPELVAVPWSKLAKAVHRLPKHPAAEELHVVRIRAKRARYAADAAGLLLPDAAAHGKALAGVTDTLGEHHDAAVGEAWLRAAVARGVTRPQALAAGLMIAALRRHAEAATGRWVEAWHRAGRRKATRWLTS